MLKTLTALAGAALAASALAQPLADLAPADAVLTLGLEVQPSRPDTLSDDLAELDWQGAVDTLGRLASELGPVLDDPSGPFGPFGPLGALGAALGGLEPDDLRAELERLDATCPGVADAADAVPAPAPGDAFLLTVGMDRFAPMPSATALARFGDPAPVAALQDALVRCFSTGEPLVQGDVELHVLGDGSDLPVVVGRMGDVFMVSTRPEALRAVVRRADGADEPSLADARLGSAVQRFGEGGLFLTVDAAAIADLVEAFALPMAGPSERPLAERAVASLRTLGGVAYRVGTSPEGLESELALAVDPAGGDPELARLLLASAPAGRPFLAPEGALAVSVDRLPLRGILDYAQGWADLVAAADGIDPEEADLRALVREETGIDLEADLLSWLGEQWTTVLLSYPSPDLRDLIQLSQAYVVPVSDPEAARAGLARIGEALRPHAGDLGVFFGGPGAGIDMALREEMGGSDQELGIAVRSYAYRGVDITRVQAGVTTDLGVALVGSRLVIATPAAAIETLVDVHEGDASSLVESRAWRDLVAAAPSGATGLGLSDDAALLEGLADLLGLAAQPVAFALDVADAEPESGSEFGGGYGWEATGTLPDADDEPLAPGTVTGELGTGDLIGDEFISDVYALQGLEPGDRVRVVLASDEFDTYLRLADASDRSYLLENDDAPGTDRSQLDFEVEPGIDYLLEVGSYMGAEHGAYELTVEVEGDAEAGTEAEAEAAPTYAELLGLTEILPEALHVIADHLGGSATWSVVDGDVVHQVSRTAIRW